MQTQQNNMATGAKTQAKKKKKSPIVRENQNKILRAYIALYNAFLLQNLMAGKTLGASSHAALQLLNAKIATMDRANPVTKLLRRIHKYHSKKITKIIMTSKHRDAHATVRPEQRAKINAFIVKNFADANKTLNAMVAQYKPKTAVKAPMAKKPQLVAAAARVENKKSNAQQQKVVLQLWLQQQQRQHQAA
jgi:hypothetical protein